MTRGVPELSLKQYAEGDAAARAAFSEALMQGVSLKVLPPCEGDGAKWPEITAGDFLAERLKAIGLTK